MNQLTKLKIVKYTKPTVIDPSAFMATTACLLKNIFTYLYYSQFLWIDITIMTLKRKIINIYLKYVSRKHLND